MQLKLNNLRPVLLTMISQMLVFLVWKLSSMADWLGAPESRLIVAPMTPADVVTSEFSPFGVDMATSVSACLMFVQNVSQLRCSVLSVPATHDS